MIIMYAASISVMKKTKIARLTRDEIAHAARDLERVLLRVGERPTDRVATRRLGSNGPLWSRTGSTTHPCFVSTTPDAGAHVDGDGSVGLRAGHERARGRRLRGSGVGRLSGNDAGRAHPARDRPGPRSLGLGPRPATRCGGCRTRARCGGDRPEEARRQAEDDQVDDTTAAPRASSGARRRDERREHVRDDHRHDERQHHLVRDHHHGDRDRGAARARAAGASRRVESPAESPGLSLGCSAK